METITKSKPAFEAIAPDFGQSFTYQKFSAAKPNKNNVWHYHPELELVYVNGGSGRRQIGSHVSYYTQGDLILIGSNLPHCGFTDASTGNSSESVVQMKADFLGSDFFDIPEMSKIRNLFEKAKGGLAFGGTSKKKIGRKSKSWSIRPIFKDSWLFSTSSMNSPVPKTLKFSMPIICPWNSNPKKMIASIRFSTTSKKTTDNLFPWRKWQIWYL